MTEIRSLCPLTWTLLSAGAQQQLLEIYSAGFELKDCLERLPAASDKPDWLADLAAVEQASWQLRLQPLARCRPNSIAKIQLNPALELIQVAWKGLLKIAEGAQFEPEAGTEFLLFWRHPRSGLFRQEIASAADLLALKVIIENLDPRVVAASTGQPVGVVDRAIEKAVLRGLLLSPPSRLARTTQGVSVSPQWSDRYLRTPAFTLQWHITQSCDLHCRHCYDRSEQADIDLSLGLKLIDQMRDFCLRHYVYGQISFSGGNPFFHPDFFTLYRAAAERNLSVAVLGNPVSDESLCRLISIEPPVFYQVSLEGLEDHNDTIRGRGSFAAVIEFLDRLKEHRIPSRVMLTLTDKNMDQVLPLAEYLRDKADLFTYNRLSMVGEGAALQSALGQDYQSFVQNYIRAKATNPIIAQKDNLINIERYHQGLDLFGGCTGFGCGAAFNFVAILPNGEVHACRKYPSPIGNIHLNSLEQIYYSDLADTYRSGSIECSDCFLRPVCGGCPAVTYGCHLSPLMSKDPACFIKNP